MNAVVDKAQTVAYYQNLAAQAQLLQSVTQSTSVEADRGRLAFLANVRDGRDAPMPLAINGRAHKVSTYLGECDRAAQALLFSACNAALCGKPAEDVKATILAFLHSVAREYGEDSAEVWGDE